MDAVRSWGTHHRPVLVPRPVWRCRQAHSRINEFLFLTGVDLPLETLPYLSALKPGLNRVNIIAAQGGREEFLLGWWEWSRHLSREGSTGTNSGEVKKVSSGILERKHPWCWEHYIGQLGPARGHPGRPHAVTARARLRTSPLAECAGQLPGSGVWAVGTDRKVKWKVTAEGKMEGWGLRGQDETWFHSTLLCDVCLCINFSFKNPSGK